MPRGRRGAAPPARSAPARPGAAAPSRPNVTPARQPARSASTAAQPPATTKQAGPPGQAGKPPGLFGQMASTAAGVAVGSSIGHALGSLFSGSGSAPAAESQQADSAVANQANEAGYQSGGWNAQSCETDAKSFTKCLDEHSGNMQICGWYLEQLKACQAASSQY